MSDIKDKTVERVAERLKKTSNISSETAVKIARESADRLNRQKRGEK